MTNTPNQPESEDRIDLKDRELAAFLAWLIPGLGHLYQGRHAKAALFFVCILGLFVYGLYLGGDSKRGWGRAVYFAGRDNYYFAGQIGIGLPAMPALIQAHRAANNKPVWWHGFMAPPLPSGPEDAPVPAMGANANQPTRSDLIRELTPYFELGTVYTMIAGLLNVLAMYDAWGGPVFPEQAKKEEDEENPRGSPEAPQP